MSVKNFDTLFKTIDNSKSISELFEVDAIPPINYSSNFFFISYSHSDYKIIYKDIFQYQKEGVSVWFDRGMKPGSDWLENAEHFISQFACKGIIIYLSKASLHSKAVLEEIKLAHTYRKPLMPIVIDTDELVDNDIAKTFIKNFALSIEETNIINKSFTERTLWVDNSFPIKSKLNYIKNLEDETALLEVVDLDENNAPILLNSGGFIKGKMLTQVNDPYCMRVKLPLDVRCIGNATFTNMANLKEIDLSNILEIDGYAFSDAKQLVEIDLSNVKYIGDSAFERCSSLERITFPGQKDLAGLFKDYDSVDLNEAYADENGKFDEEQFNEDYQHLLETWYVDDNSAYGEGQRIIPNEEDYNIDTYYGKNIFAHCDSLKEITLENTFKNVPEGCFHDCKGLEKVVFNGPNYIGPRAFYNCINLKTVEFLDDANSFESFADQVSDNDEEYDDIDNFGFEFLGEGSSRSSRPNESQRALYLDKKVQEIGEHAFEDCKSLKNFELPFEIRKIGEAAFKNSGVDIPYLYIKCEVGKQAFMGASISTISVSNKLDIPDELCRGCQNLKNLYLDQGENNIGASSFRDCPNLGKTYVSCKEILKSAFSHSGLTSLVLAESISNVWEYAFSTCEKLEYVEIRCKNVSFAPAAFYQDKIKYLYIAKESHITFDPLSLEKTEIERIYYDGNLEDIRDDKLSLEIDFVDDPNTTQAFLFEEDRQEYLANREKRLNEAKENLLPYLLSRLAFYSDSPIYDGQHWHFSSRTNKPEIWNNEK